MDQSWTKGLTPAAKADFEQYLRNCTPIIDKLTEILTELETTALRDTKTDYDSPSWAFKQADNNGYRRALRHTLKLLSLK